jgi:hypothetical protein
MKKATLSILATTSLPPTKTKKVSTGCNFRLIDFLKILVTTTNLFCVIIYYADIIKVVRVLFLVNKN